MKKATRLKFLSIAALMLGGLAVSASAYDDNDHPDDHHRKDKHRHDNVGVDVGVGRAGVDVNVYPRHDYYRDHRDRAYYRPGRTVIIERESPVYYGRSVGFEVQSRLAREGYYRGPVDGDVGPGTRAAIRAYQLDNGLAPTAQINNALLNSLRIR